MTQPLPLGPWTALLLLPVLLLPAALWAAPTSVQVATVTQGTVNERFRLIGSAIARRNAPISAQVPGLINKMLVDRGSRVKQGDELFRLDDALARIEVDRTKAQLAQADAEVAESERKLSEAKRLRNDGHIPQSALDTAQTLTMVAQAQRDQRRADLARARTLMAQHRVQAPFDGAVVAKTAEVGQWIRTDSPVVTLAQLEPARVEVPVPQNMVARIQVGMRAQVRFESMPDETFSASVSTLIPQGQIEARTFPIWLELPNEVGRIAPGMSAEVTLAVDGQQALKRLVPNDALVRRADGSTLLWVVRDAEVTGQEGPVVQSVVVKVGRSSAGVTEVSTAQKQARQLQVGDQVVIRGNESLRPNQSVRILPNRAGTG